MITIYLDHLKPGETRVGGPWCYYITSGDGHITRNATGFNSREEALEDANKYV